MLSLFRNFLFSSTLGFKNFEYRISKIFYQRFLLDIILKLLSMTPHLILFYSYITFSSDFSQYKEIMFNNGQNINGYINMIIGVFILILIISILILNIILSIVKLNMIEIDFSEIENNEKNKNLNYKEKVKNATLNMWYISFELLLIVYAIWCFINLYVGINLTLIDILQKFIPSLIISGFTSLIIGLIISIKK